MTLMDVLCYVRGAEITRLSVLSEGGIQASLCFTNVKLLTVTMTISTLNTIHWTSDIYIPQFIRVSKQCITKRVSKHT